MKIIISHALQQTNKYYRNLRIYQPGEGTEKSCSLCNQSVWLGDLCLWPQKHSTVEITAGAALCSATHPLVQGHSPASCCPPPLLLPSEAVWTHPSCWHNQTQPRPAVWSPNRHNWQLEILILSAKYQDLERYAGASSCKAHGLWNRQIQIWTFYLCFQKQPTEGIYKRWFIHGAATRNLRPPTPWKHKLC